MMAIKEVENIGTNVNEDKFLSNYEKWQPCYVHLSGLWNLRNIK